MQLFHFLLFVPAGEPLGTLFFCYAGGGTAGHSVFFVMPAGEPLGTLFFCCTSGGTAGHLLSYCQLLLDAATVGTDHVDATNTDVGIDGFAWLDGEVSDGETTHVDDAYISFTT